MDTTTLIARARDELLTEGRTRIGIRALVLRALVILEADYQAAMEYVASGMVPAQADLGQTIDQAAEAALAKALNP